VDGNKYNDDGGDEMTSKTASLKGVVTRKNEKRAFKTITRTNSLTAKQYNNELLQIFPKTVMAMTSSTAQHYRYEVTAAATT